MNNITPNAKVNKARRLYKLNKFEKAESVYRELFLENRELLSSIDEKRFIESIRISHIKNGQTDDELAFYGNFVYENFSQVDCSNRNYIDPFADLLLELAKKHYEDNNHYESIKWTYRLKEDYLSNKARKNMRNNNLNYSHREKWHVRMVKSLMGLKKYNDALKFAFRLLNDLPDTGSDAKYWIKFDIAKIYYELEAYDLSIEYLNELLSVRKENYFFKWLAENYLAKEDYENALVNGITYVQVKKDIPSCVNFFVTIGDILNKLGYDEAMDHYYLAYSIKKARGYFIQYDLEQKIMDSDRDLDLNNTNYKKLVKDLKPFWNRIIYSNREQFTGTICYVRQDGEFGFITPDAGGENQYFSFRDFKDDKDFIWNDMRVSYYIEDSFDSIKGKESTRAVNVELI